MKYYTVKVKSKTETDQYFLKDHGMVWLTKISTLTTTFL